MNILVFDIETIPDIANLRKIYELPSLNDEEVLSAVQTLRRQENQSNFLPLHLQKIIAISTVLATEDTIKVWSLGQLDSVEKELIERFFAGMDKYHPILVSWNGCGFDLPVLHYRSLIHGISAPLYWENGELESCFKYNNYLNRYHYRHLDLMDILASYQGRANAPLNDLALMLNLPGKMGMSGSEVWPSFQKGELEQIRNYCETDVLNTYLIYLRFELMRGRFNQSEYQKKCLLLNNYLLSSEKAHLKEFATIWNFSSYESSNQAS